MSAPATEVNAVSNEQIHNLLMSMLGAIADDIKGIRNELSQIKLDQGTIKHELREADSKAKCALRTAESNHADLLILRRSDEGLAKDHDDLRRDLDAHRNKSEPYLESLQLSDETRKRLSKWTKIIAGTIVGLGAVAAVIHSAGHWVTDLLRAMVE